MGMIRLDLEGMRIGAPERSQVTHALERFLSDMNADVSGFFHLPQKSTFEAEYERVKSELAQRAPEIDTFIHIGIGGSSLGPETIVRALAGKNAPQFHFLDNIDPDDISRVLRISNPASTMVYVVTKSGNTYETIATFMVVYEWLKTALGEERAKNHLVFCTDPVVGDLRKLSTLWNIPTFTVPSSVGGRFSALTAVGLFPAVVAGADPAQLIKGAQDWRKQFIKDLGDGGIPPATDLAYRLLRLYKDNRRNITTLMPYSAKLKTFSAWFTQLWAESLGKNGLGLTPLAATGATDQHSVLQLLRDGPHDKVVGFVEVVGFESMLEFKWTGPDLPAFEGLRKVTMNQLMDAELNATRQVMANNERPQFSVILPKLNAHTLGQLLFFAETLTAIAGYMLEINPFDQPGVEEGKILTRERIAACKKSLMS